LPADTGDFYRLLGPALGTAAAAYFLQLWKYSRDAYLARVDEACGLVIDLADAGAKNWSTAKLLPQPKIGAPPSTDAREKYREFAVAENWIDGRVQQLQFFRLILQDRFAPIDREKLIELTASFQDALTGSNFSSASRAADQEQAKQVYAAASDLIAHMRGGAARGSTLGMSFFRLLAGLLPYRRPTTRRGKIEERIFLWAFVLCVAVGAALIGLQMIG
jgi:hypothetical protein